MSELLYEFIEDLPSFIGFVVHPEDVVVGRLGHLLGGLYFGQVVDGEIEIAADLSLLHVGDFELGEGLKQEFLFIFEVGHLADGLA